MKNNIFKGETIVGLTNRLDKLESTSTPKWGKMTVGQMLAHINVAYEMAYDERNHKKPNGFVKFMLKMLVKDKVVGDKPFKKNGQTAPQFLMTETKDFNVEKARVISYMEKTKNLGEAHFEGKESHSFGKLTAKEWNTSFYKHLDHHLTQFGV